MMFNILNLSNYELLMHALDRISNSEQFRNEGVNNIREEDYDHTQFNILRYIEEPS